MPIQETLNYPVLQHKSCFGNGSRSYAHCLRYADDLTPPVTACLEGQTLGAWCSMVHARFQTGWVIATFSVGHAHQSPCPAMHQDAGSPDIQRPASSAILSYCSPWNNTLVVNTLTRTRRNRIDSRTVLDVKGRDVLDVKGPVRTCIPAGLCISVHGMLFKHFAAILPEQACASRMAA